MERHFATEQWLERFGVGYTLEAIPMEYVDVTESLKMQNRMDSRTKKQKTTIDQDHAFELGMWMEVPGQTVPPIVVAKSRSRSRFAIIDGNHRYTGASELKWTMISAYVVEVKTEDALRALVLTANAREGKSLSPMERNNLAISFAGLYSTRQAATEFGIPLSTMSTMVRSKEGAQKVQAAVKVEISTRSKLPDLARLDIDQIKALGAEQIQDTTVTALRNAVTAILDVPASDRHDVALVQSGVLRKGIIDSKQPKCRPPRKPTGGLNSDRLALIKMRKHLADNPAWRLDQDYMVAVNEFVKEVGQDGRNDQAVA